MPDQSPDGEEVLFHKFIVCFGGGCFFPGKFFQGVIADFEKPDTFVMGEMAEDVIDLALEGPGLVVDDVKEFVSLPVDVAEVIGCAGRKLEQAPEFADCNPAALCIRILPAQGLYKGVAHCRISVGVGFFEYSMLKLPGTGQKKQKKLK